MNMKRTKKTILNLTSTPIYKWIHFIHYSGSTVEFSLYIVNQNVCANMKPCLRFTWKGIKNHPSIYIYRQSPVKSPEIKTL